MVVPSASSVSALISAPAVSPAPGCLPALRVLALVVSAPVHRRYRLCGMCSGSLTPVVWPRRPDYLGPGDIAPSSSPTHTHLKGHSFCTCTNPQRRRVEGSLKCSPSPVISPSFLHVPCVCLMMMRCADGKCGAFYIHMYPGVAGSSSWCSWFLASSCNTGAHSNVPPTCVLLSNMICRIDLPFSP
jgi:hypothetical protein